MAWAIYIDWPLKLSNYWSQNSSSCNASAFRFSFWHHAVLQLRLAYRLWVIRRVTGPKPRDTDMILPITLANSVAWTCGTSLIYLMADLSDLIFSGGTANTPLFKSIWKPSHSIACYGAHILFSALIIEPAFSKLVLTWLLALMACSSPFTLTILSSKYKITLSPLPHQNLTNGLISLVNT